ncbi:MAG: channel protein TolC [Gammaproteobacteria bacterium CG_4_10_14_0_8_um_filter_38_16]|nr:MAG: channel protein TolC [Gammaproteobacteria bacterium CG_4_10_14_0_8_um_filter_38_16]PJA03863.1 MAG: channel protein TolC [Gammaproteobacteria bacterium CG_4_10_14_0_2_um_filter_38_22]PJB10836.1 MAG: channel protein TolC [Gammaproteobacteria bacterium CG_4_9_14_3_um_filter_38_9]
MNFLSADFFVKPKLIKIGVCVAMVLSSSAYADNLMRVYQQALHSDPIFAQAKSTWESQKMNLPIAEAGYLPQLSVAGNGDRVNDQTNAGGTGTVTSNDWEYGYTLTLTQPIFDFGAWSAIKNASASVKAATANYIAAQQSLMQRTATAYFSVLQAYDQLRYTIANKRAVWQQYVTAREQFKVGLIAITDEYNARSSYDQVVAQQISAQNNLNIQLENLRAITGHEYRSLSGLGRLPMLRPQPNNINRWVTIATQQNYGIKAQNYNVLAAMETIKQQQAGGYPVLDAQGSYADTHVTTSGSLSWEQKGSAGLALTYQPIQGGLVIASTKQARYNYVTASGQLEQVHRNVVNQARSSFLSVLSSISRVTADKQTIISAKNSLEATKAGFHAGTRTMVDVLNALSALYQAQQQHANDQYAYINNLIALKAAAGTLSVRDLQKINAWLGKSIHFPAQTSVARVPNENNKDEVIKTDHDEVAFHSIQPKLKKIISKKKSVVLTEASIKYHHAPILLAPPTTTSLPQPAST